MNDLSKSEQLSPVGPSPEAEGIKLMRNKTDIMTGKELLWLKETHRRGGDSVFQKEFLPHLWFAYQTYYPDELVKICRLYPDAEGLDDKQILDKYLPRNWDWTDVPKCVESKLAILDKLQTLISAPPAVSSPVQVQK